MGQVAVSLVLLVGAGLMVRGFRELQSVDPGFRPDGLAVVRVSAPASVAGTHEGRVAFFTEVLARMEALPGVEAAGGAHIFPLDDEDWGYAYSVEDEPPADPNQAHSAIGRIVTHGFFRAAGILLLGGRTFLETDALDAPGVAVVSRAFEERFWPAGSALGRRIKRGSYGRDRPWLEIVGVVDDVRSGGLEEDIRPAVYYPMSQTDGAYVSVMAVGVRGSVPAESLIPAVRRVVTAVGPSATTYRTTTGESIVSRSLGRVQFNGLVLLIFAGVGLLLAATGVYGVTVYSVGRRTREFGLRMALGAQGIEIIHGVLRGAFVLAVTGVRLGLSASVALTSLLSDVFLAVEPFDPLVYGAVSSLLAAVVLLATYLPARRATRVSPTVALRDD